MATIHLRNIAHSYNPGYEPREYALKQLNLTWEHGQTYALLGPSGCGKTTLLNIISGLIKPSDGHVHFDDTDVTRMPTAQRNIAQVFQFPVNYDTMTVRDNLAFPLINKGDSRSVAYKRADEIAEILEVTDILDTRAEGLTADLKQLVSLGRGLVRKDVSAILFDEPLTVIDPARKWHLRSKIKEIQRQFNHTMIYVTHDQTEALTFADNVVVMETGEIRQIGSPKDLFERPEHTFVGYFIGSPGMNIIPLDFDNERILIGDQPLGIDLKENANSDKLELGIRPEFITLNSDAADFEITIKNIENIGKHKIVRGAIGTHDINIIVQESDEINGDTIFVNFDPKHTMIYANGALVEGTENG